MDPQRFRDVYERLQLLDDRLGHKVRPGRGVAVHRATPEQLEERLRDLAAFTLELRELVFDLVVAIGSSPAPPPASE